ncbi:MAG: hypothetical protein M3271_09585 [Actinomycetota bacterium]|nr:hypothetical protein [Actinomycetota bacterium]
MAVIVGLWVLACAAALALATTNDEAAAQGCRGGSPSPTNSASASHSPSESGLPIPVSLPPVPAPDGDAKEAAEPQPAPAPPPLDPHKKVPVVIAQQDTCKSTITIAYEAGKSPKFTGKVGSDARECRRARDVTVKKVKRGADLTVGKATTNAKGKYVVPARQSNGRFYAKVSKATVENEDGQTIRCGAARSRTIRP